MRRVYLRGRDNILKRLLVHGAAFNLSLILRKTQGVGKARLLQGLCFQLLALSIGLYLRLQAGWRRKIGDGVHFTSQSLRFYEEPPLRPGKSQVTHLRFAA
jgi:hypothetical protein